MNRRHWLLAAMLGALTAPGAHAAARNKWFRDVAVLAFPTPTGEIAQFDNYDIKTLKDVRPYSSNKKAPTSVRAQADYPEPLPFVNQMINVLIIICFK